MNEPALFFIYAITVLLTIAFYVSAIVLLVVAAIRVSMKKNAAVFIIIGAIFLVLAVAFTVLLSIATKGAVISPKTDYPTYLV